MDKVRCDVCVHSCEHTGHNMYPSRGGGNDALLSASSESDRLAHGSTFVCPISGNHLEGTHPGALLPLDTLSILALFQSFENQRALVSNAKLVQEAEKKSEKPGARCLNARHGNGAKTTTRATKKPYVHLLKCKALAGPNIHPSYNPSVSRLRSFGLRGSTQPCSGAEGEGGSAAL